VPEHADFSVALSSTSLAGGLVEVVRAASPDAERCREKMERC
jgi:hypothetical protein